VALVDEVVADAERIALIELPIVGGGDGDGDATTLGALLVGALVNEAALLGVLLDEVLLDLALLGPGALVLAEDALGGLVAPLGERGAAILVLGLDRHVALGDLRVQADVRGLPNRGAARTRLLHLELVLLRGGDVGGEAGALALRVHVLVDLAGLRGLVAELDAVPGVAGVVTALARGVGDDLGVQLVSVQRVAQRVLLARPVVVGRVAPAEAVASHLG